MENEIQFTVTQCNNGYVLETRVDYNYKRVTGDDIEDGKTIHADTNEVVEQIKKVLTPKTLFATNSKEVPF